MKLFRAVTLACVVCLPCGCASRVKMDAVPVIDFQELTVAGIRPGDRDEKVVELLGHPNEVRYGRGDSPREFWHYYDLGMKVVVGKQSREVDEVIVFLNDTRAFRPFRGRIAQGFPLATRLVDAKPHLQGYSEVDITYRGYREAQVYSDDIETARVIEENVSLGRTDGAKMTVHFDYDKWMQSVVLERAESTEVSGGEAEREPDPGEAGAMEKEPGSVEGDAGETAAEGEAASTAVPTAGP